MRFAMFLSLSLAAVALAGCSDDPAAGEFSSSGPAYGIDGHVHSSEFQEFVDPTPQPLKDNGVMCLADNVPEVPPATDPLDSQRCTPAYSELNYLFTTLPQATWTMAFTDSNGVNPDLAAGALTDNGDGTFAWNYTQEGTYVMETHDQVTLYAGSTAVATSGLGSGDSLQVVEALSGIGYSATYSGRDVTVTVTGIDAEAPVAISGWLVLVDDAGAKTHEEQVTLAAGENTYTAGMAIADFQEFHIHLAGTAVNLATGTVA